MNERIRELALNAGFAHEPKKYQLWAGDGPTEIMISPGLKKFAELIVRECVDWIDGSPTTDAGQLLLSKSFIIANLKGHFGVK